MNNTTLCDRIEKHIQNEHEPHNHCNLYDIRRMEYVIGTFHNLILLVKEVDISKERLIDKNQKKPRHSEERWDKIQFFEGVKVRHELPSIENDFFFQSRWRGLCN